MRPNGPRLKQVPRELHDCLALWWPHANHRARARVAGSIGHHRATHVRTSNEPQAFGRPLLHPPHLGASLSIRISSRCCVHSKPRRPAKGPEHKLILPASVRVRASDLGCRLLLLIIFLFSSTWTDAYFTPGETSDGLAPSLYSSRLASPHGLPSVSFALVVAIGREVPFPLRSSRVDSPTPHCTVATLSCPCAAVNLHERSIPCDASLQLGSWWPRASSLLSPPPSTRCFWRTYVWSRADRVASLELVAVLPAPIE
jgi:hypothetical protein